MSILAIRCDPVATTPGTDFITPTKVGTLTAPAKLDTTVISSSNASLRVPRLPDQADRESHEVDGRFALTNRVVHP